METYKEEGERALKHLKIADHMLTQTYPLINDPKLLIAVMQNIFLALTSSMSAILYYERYLKRIPPFSDTFESKFNVFRARCLRRYRINADHVMLIQEIRELLAEHRNSPVEFARKDKFVICSENYSLKTVSIEKMKQYINRTKDFIMEMEIMTGKNGRILGRG